MPASQKQVAAILSLVSLLMQVPFHARGAAVWLVGWGSSSSGQTSVPDAAADFTAIAGGWYHSLALSSSGAAAAWGDNIYGQTNIPASLTNVAVVAGGWYHSLALQSNGTVTVWGDNTYGQANVPAAL